MNRIFLMVLCCTLFFAGLYAQPIADPKLIEQRVHAELDAWQQDPAQLSFVARHFPEVRGTVVADITLSGKGRIETFFLSETDIKENTIYDLIGIFEMSNKDDKINNL